MSTYTVTTSAELMENYIQADFLLPQEKFTALQTDAGASLLFSIGTGGVFHLTIESPGEVNGWRQVDLAAAQNKADFDGKATVKNFAAAQAVPAQTGGATQIHLGLVLTDGTNDRLYLSLNNSDADLHWTEQPAWTAVPFNAVNSDGTPVAAPDPVQIVNVLIGEASDHEYIIVDTVRNPGQSADFISRYYIDTTHPSAPKWIPRDLPIDVRAVNDDSCLGRMARSGGIDGVYTKGFVGTSAQLVYTPVVNAIDPAMPPAPSLLKLPGGLIADAIAAARNPDNTSDLYVASQGSLYWFASTNQRNQATGVRVATSPLLAAVRNLYAYTAGDTVTVWGLNGDDQVFYLTCPAGRQQAGAAWNVPLTILAGADAISPFIDRNYNANTFFAHCGTGLVKVMKSPTTTLWTSRSITLPAAATTAPATPIHSYTTHIQVTGADGQAAPNVPVTLTATNVTSVYVNHLYYLIGPSPIQLSTDALGTITIVEATASLAATRYQISVAAQPQIAVNTMDTAWQRNAKYTTVDSLKSAKIVSRDGSTRNFVPAGTSADALKGVAQTNQALASAYDRLSSEPTPPAAGTRVLAPPVTLMLAADSVAVGLAGGAGDSVAAGVAGGAGDSILVDVGDLFGWLAAGADALVSVIEDVANDVWYVVATIGDAVYRGVLDCVEAVVAAATWVYNAIKIAVEDVILFLEFLFGWQDILVTHRVLKNVFLCLGQSTIDGIEAAKARARSVSAELQAQIDAWADIPDFPQTMSATLASAKPASQQNSAPANLGVHHFQGSAASASSNLSPLGPAEEILADLVNLLEAEGDTLHDAVNAIKTDIIDQFGSLSVTDVIKKFLAIVADSVLQSTENILVTVLDVFGQLVQGMMDVLTATLDIPVLGWLYRELTGDDLSFLDVVCLVAAIPVTIIYKATAQAAPFADDDPFTNGLLAAKNWSGIQAQFLRAPHATQVRPAASADRTVLATATAAAAGVGAAPVLDEGKVKIFSFVTGIASLAGGAVLIVMTNVQRTLDLFSVDIARAKTLATIICVGNIAYVSPNISTMVNAESGDWSASLNNAVTGISILKGIAAIPATTFTNPVVGKIFGFVESFINVVWNVPVIANCIAHKDDWTSTYKSLIPESVGNFCFNLGGTLEFFIVLAIAAKEPDVLAGLVLVQAGLMTSYGVCMIVAGGIYAFAPDQRHA